MSTPTTWTVGTILNWTADHFKEKALLSPRLDAELLLCKVLKLKRLDLYMNFERVVEGDELGQYRGFVKRRLQFEPVAYILNEKEFYGRSFYVGPGVLIPRPETEHVIDSILERIADKQSAMRILDAGVGSGCIAATLACELPQSHVTALDKMSEALEIAKMNSERLACNDRVTLVQGDVLAFQSEELFDVVASNPPYIGENQKSALSLDVVNHEPHTALFGGKNGSELLQPWIAKLASLLKPDGILACEIGFDQKEVVLEIATALGCLTNIEVQRDYSGHSRVLVAKKGKSDG